jgi:hypothetical protein
LTYITVEEKQFKKASLLVGTNSNEALSSLGEKIYFCFVLKLYVCLNIVVDQWAIEKLVPKFQSYNSKVTHGILSGTT